VVLKKYLFFCLLHLITFAAAAQAPVVLGTNPSSGPVGATVTIGGFYFNTAPANDVVFFGGVKATVLSATSTSLTVTVPTGATYKPISVLNTTNGLTGYSITPFTVTSDSKSSISASDIDPKVDFTAGYLPQVISMTDIDGDGKLDMAVLNASTSSFSVSIFRNTATKGVINASSFASRTDIPAGNTPIGLLMQDLDGDGKPELIVLNKADNNVSVYHNNSVGSAISFGPKTDFPTGSAPVAFAVGDVDGDGKPDIVTTNGTAISILANNSIKGSLTTSSFAAKFDIAGAFSSVLIADVDADAKLDIVGLNSAGISVYHNIGTIAGQLNASIFDKKVDFALTNGATTISVADINNDGKPDFITVNKSTNSVSVILNTTNGSVIDNTSFAAPTTYATGKLPYLAAVDDIDGDGLLDIVVVNYTDGSISLLKNTTAGSLSFAPKIDIPIAQFSSSVSLGDIDGDGRPDIVVTNNLTTVSVLRNNPTNPPVISSISPMSGPVGTTVTITGTNFNKNATANNVVFFGAAKAVVTSATATQIVVTVPPGSTYKPITVLNTETARSAFSLKPFNVTYAGNTGIKAPDFEILSGNRYYAGQSTMLMDMADIDGDGKPDIVTINQNANSLMIWRSNGLMSASSGQYAPPAASFDGGTSVDKFRIGDLDGDGRPDIVTISGTTHTITILRNISTPGNIAFDKKITIVNYDYIYDDEIVLADFDMDGKLDMATGRNTGGSLTIYRNTSSTGFISFAAANPMYNVSTGNAMEAGDIDGDGKPDLVLSSYDYSGNGGIYLLQNTSSTGKISFNTPVQVSQINTNLILADINGDGKLDIVAANGLFVLKNTATAGVINTSSMSDPIKYDINQDIPVWVTSADVDGDGKPDLITTNVDNNNHSTLSIYHNTSTSNTISFDVPVDIETPAAPNSIVASDVDGDGIPDLVTLTGGTIIQPIYYHAIPVSQTITPKITGISPLSGPVGTLVTISGSNFSTLPSGNTVFIGNVSLTVTTTDPNRLTINVPPGGVFSNVVVTNNSSKRISNSWTPFIVTFNSKNSFSAADLSDPAYIRTGVPGNRATILADMDGDGKLDLVVPNDQTYSNFKVSIYRNISVPGTPLSAASFAPKVDFDGSVTTIMDVDGDGKPDLIGHGGGPFVQGGSFSVRQNTSTPGNFSFGAPVYTGTNYATLASIAADIDGDGLLDMISQGDSFTKAVVISQNTTRSAPFTFNIEKSFPVKAPVSGLVVADFDGDGKPDIIAGGTDGSLSVLRNISSSNTIGTSSFAPYKVIDIAQTLFSYPTVADIDGDGKPDLVVGSSSDSTICVLRNTSVAGTISFAPKVVFKVQQLQYGGIAIADIDGDGKPDVIVTVNNDYTQPTGFSIFRNTSTPGNFTSSSFVPRVDVATGAISSLAAGDLDGDGKPDLLVTIGSVLAIFQNNPHIAAKPTITAFAPASAVQGITVTIKGTDFTGATAVSFGGIPAASFTVVSPRVITAVVASGANGQIAVTTPLGTGTIAGFTYGQSVAATGPVITPLADVVTLALDNNGTRNINIANIATVNSASASPQITLSPASFNCSSVGMQTVTVKVDDPGAPANPAAVKFNYPGAVTFDIYGNMYISDNNNLRIRKISTAGLVTTFAGNGTTTNTDGKAVSSGLATNYASSIAVDPFGNVYVTAGVVRKIDTQGNMTTYVGSNIPSGDSTYPGSDVASVMSLGAGIVAARDGTLYMTDTYGGTVSKITPTGVMTLFAGIWGTGNQDGQGRYSSFFDPRGIAMDDNGNLYVADSGNGLIRKITPSGLVSTIKTTGTYFYPNAVAVDHAGVIYMTDGNAIAKIGLDGVVTVIAGNRDATGAYVDGQGIAARFNAPSGIAIDNNGNIYVADSNNNCIRKIDATGLVTTFAGGVKGYQDGSIGTAASSATAQIKVKITSNVVITSNFADQLLPLDATAKATIPDYTLGTAISSSCGTSNIVISQSPVAGTRLNAADKTTVTITATDASGYSVSKSFTATADANKAIVFNAFADQLYGTADITPNFTPPTNSTVTFTSSNTSVAIIVNNKVHIVGVGSAAITATSAGPYTDQKSQTINVKPAPLTATADNKTRSLGSVNPTFTISYSGFVNSDTQTSIATQPTATTIATNISAPGTYPINLSGGAATNYTFTYVPGILTVTNALPANNFTISANSATCHGSANGSISISAAQNLNYTATITGGSVNATYPFTTSSTINNMAAGTYNVCFTVAGQSSYQQCFTVVITEPKDLSVYAAVNNTIQSVNLTLDGGSTYFVTLNGVTTTTTASSVTLALNKGVNDITVTTDKPCQGIYQKRFDLSPDILAYPNPFTSILNVSLGNDNVSSATVELFNTAGVKVYSKQFNNTSGLVQIDAGNIIPGIYMLKLTTAQTEKIFKVVKQ